MRKRSKLLSPSNNVNGYYCDVDMTNPAAQDKNAVVNLQAVRLRSYKVLDNMILNYVVRVSKVHKIIAWIGWLELTTIKYRKKSGTLQNIVCNARRPNTKPLEL